MSWLGGSLSSFTDQISNFTKDILTEGTEEVSDHVTELQLAKAKIAELEAVIVSNKTENDRLKHATSEYSEKAESAELQILRISHEYRNLLQQKESEIKELKDKHHELMEHQSKAHHHDPHPSQLHVSHRQSPSLADSGVGDCESNEIGDHISMQKEINRLSHETQHLRMQCDHWRHLAQTTRPEDSSGISQKLPDSQDVVSLKSQLKEFKQQMAIEKETHQQEIAALQDLHSHKISTLKQQHQVELDQFTERLTHLQHSLLHEQRVSAASAEHKQVGLALTLSRLSLLNQLDTNHADALEMLGDIKQLRDEINDDADLRQDRLTIEKMDLTNELSHAIQQKKKLAESLTQMEAKQAELSSETEKMVAALGSEENQALTAEIVKSLERENLILKNKVLEVKEQLVLVERTVETLMHEKQNAFDRNLPNHGSTRWSLQTLQDLVTDLRAEIEEKDQRIEMLERGADGAMSGDVTDVKDPDALVDEKLLSQKDALEIQGRLNGQKSELAMQETELSMLGNELEKQKGLLDMQKKELEMYKDRFETEKCQLEMEKDELQTSLEQLDRQHEEAMAEMFMIRDNLTQKVHILEERLEAQVAETSALMEELSGGDVNAERVIALQGEVAGLKEQLLSSGADNNVEELTEKLRANAMALNDLHMDKAELVEEIKFKDKEIVRMAEKIKTLREEKVMRDSEDKKDCDHAEIEVKLAALSGDVESKVAYIKDLECQLRSIVKEMENNQEIKERLESRVAELEVSSNEGAFVSMKDEFENTQKTLMDVQDELIMVKEEYNKAVKDKFQILDNVADLNLKNQSFESELISLKQNLERESLQKSDYVSKNNDLVSKVKNLESQLYKKENSSKVSAQYESDLLGQVEELTEQVKRLEGDLGQSESRIASQVQHYERCIQELKTSKESESSKLEKERMSITKTSKEKDRRIGQLEKNLSDVQGDIGASKEKIASYEKEISKLSGILKEKEQYVEKLLKDNILITEKLNTKSTELRILQQNELVREKEVLQQSPLIDGVDSPVINSENAQNFEKLEKVIESANHKIANLTEENKKLQRSSDVDKDYISELEKKNESMNDVIGGNAHEDFLRQIAVLQDLNINLESTCQKQKDEITEIRNELLLQRADVGRVSSKEDGDTVNDIRYDTETSSDIVNKVDKLQETIRTKNHVISDLQKANSALVKLVESKSAGSSGDKVLTDLHKQKNEIQSLKAEREQMMSVLNEKTRECSSLKAEVHRLMGTVMAEKTALNKLQQDNVELKNQPFIPTSTVQADMQKEAIQKLSNLVKDKDLEIEALAMKNGSLLEVLHGVSDNGSQMNKMIFERDHLMRQINELTSQREQICHVLNQKHQESVSYHNEIQRLQSVIAEEAAKYQHLEQDYSTLKHQYEDGKIALVKYNDEIVSYRQKYTDLEIKFGEMAQRDDIKNTVDVASYNEKLNEISRLKDGMIMLEKSVSEKSGSLNSLQRAYSDLESNLSCVELEKNSYKKQVENLAIQIHMLQQEASDAKQEFEQMEQQCKKQMTEIQILKEMNDKLSLSLRDKEFESLSLAEKLKMLQAVMGENENEGGQLDVVLKDNESLQIQRQVSQQERDQLTLALKQSQNECSELSHQLQKVRSKEQKQVTELGRLREHLLKIEESYTQEALVAEEREKDLRTRLMAAEDHIASSTQTIQTANQQASLQLEGLQAQLVTLANQRDTAYLQVASLQEQTQDDKLQLANLQMVLEEFQKEKESMLAAETDRYEVIIARQQHQLSSLNSDLSQTKEQLEEALEGLDASARLTAQLDKKEETIRALRDEVHLREKFLAEAEDVIKKHQSSSEAKVDKILMKNLMLGYFSTPVTKRPEVIHTIGGVLGFTHEEFTKATGDGERSWVPGFLRFRANPTPPATPARSRPVSGSSFVGSTPHTEDSSLNKSFSELFVKFLEKESSPPRTVQLPAQQMVDETQRQKPQYNPFTAARHATLPLSPGGRHSPHDSHPLMASAVVAPDVPLFVNLSNETERKSTLAISQQLHTQQQHSTVDPQHPQHHPSGVSSQQLNPIGQRTDATKPNIAPSPFVNSFVNPLPRNNTPSPLTLNPSSSAILKNALSGK